MPVSIKGITIIRICPFGFMWIWIAISAAVIVLNQIGLASNIWTRISLPAPYSGYYHASIELGAKNWKLLLWEGSHCLIVKFLNLCMKRRISKSQEYTTYLLYHYQRIITFKLYTYIQKRSFFYSGNFGWTCCTTR